MTKYVILLGDGMADQPHEAFGGLTVMQAARTPNLDELARRGEVGLVQTVPPGMSPGSDVANLSALGYAPADFYTGRAPLEAASIGVTLGEDEIALRCNLVTTREEDGRTLMDDYSAGHIATEDAKPFIAALNERLAAEGVRFYTGVGYRHLAVTRAPQGSLKTRAPHDIMGRPTEENLPTGDGSDTLVRWMAASREAFAKMPENRKRSTPVSQAWFWGQGTAPTMPTMAQQYGLRGAVVSAVDLVKGIGVYLGLDVLNVEGATGWLDTNYAGKVRAAMDFLYDGGDFVYVHIEAPDECGHVGDPAKKKQAIEDFDTHVVGPVFRRLSESGGPYRLMVLPDHPTPLALRTHTSDPVPYVLAKDVAKPRTEDAAYNEVYAARTGLLIPSGPDLFRRFMD